MNKQQKGTKANKASIRKKNISGVIFVLVLEVIEKRALQIKKQLRAEHKKKKPDPLILHDLNLRSLELLQTVSDMETKLKKHYKKLEKKKK